MENSNDENGDEKKNERKLDSPHLKTENQEPRDNSPQRESSITSPGDAEPPAELTARVQQLLSKPIAHDSSVILHPSGSNLNLSRQIPSTSRALSLEDKGKPLISPSIPSVAIDSSRCRLPSSSASEESIHPSQRATLGVSSWPQKTSPDRSDSDTGSSEQSPPDQEKDAKPRQKKSTLKAIMSRFSQAKNKKESAAKGDKSPTKPHKGAKKDKSPSRDKSPKRDKSPRERSPKRDAKSPIFGGRQSPFEAIREAAKIVLQHKKEASGSDTEQLFADDTPATVQVREKGRKDHWPRDIVIPKDFQMMKEINSSDTTCDSQSTQPSTDNEPDDDSRKNVPRNPSKSPKSKDERDRD